MVCAKLCNSFKPRTTNKSFENLNLEEGGSYTSIYL